MKFSEQELEQARKIYLFTLFYLSYRRLGGRTTKLLQGCCVPTLRNGENGTRQDRQKKGGVNYDAPQRVTCDADRQNRQNEKNGEMKPKKGRARPPKPPKDRQNRQNEKNGEMKPKKQARPSKDRQKTAKTAKTKKSPHK